MPPPDVTRKYARLRRLVVDSCRALNVTGLSQGSSGNISVRVADGFLVTPSGVPYGTLRPEQIVPMTLQGRPRGDGKPSSEWRIHRDIYASFSEARAVVHTHPTFCTAIACARIGIPAFHYMVAVAGGADIRCARYATFGTQALSDNVIQALRDRRACLMANHGMICYERDLDSAMRLANEVETLARQFWYARQTDTLQLLSKTEMKKIMRLFRDYGPAPR